MANEILLAYVTIPDEKAAQTLAGEAVEAGLCAGVNIVGPIHSIYRWQGETRSRTEWLLLAQTTSVAWRAFENFVTERHTDLVPCVMALPPGRVASSFHTWILENVTSHHPH